MKIFFKAIGLVLLGLITLFVQLFIYGWVLALLISFILGILNTSYDFVTLMQLSMSGLAIISVIVSFIKENITD